MALPTRLEVARLAAWLGLVGFGGGYAVLAQIEAAVTSERRRWMSHGEYAEVVAVAQSLPGASAANFFTFLGLRAGGLSGAALATAAFLAPSALLMIGFGAAYDVLRHAHQVEAIFAGMSAAVVAVIVFVAWTLAQRARRLWQIAVAALSGTAVTLGVGVLEVILVGLLVSAVVFAIRQRRLPPRLPPLLLWPLVLPQLLVVFLRIGASSFGGGLALIPILDHEVVGTLGWLTPREFSDAVTLGQITPGPVAITATFVGFRVAGVVGALAATLAVFAPPFALSVAVGHSLARFRSSPLVQSTLATLMPIVVGVVAAAALSLGRATIHAPIDVVVLAASLLLLFAMRAPTLLVLALAAGARALALYW